MMGAFRYIARFIRMLSEPEAPTADEQIAKARRRLEAIEEEDRVAFEASIAHIEMVDGEAVTEEGRRELLEKREDADRRRKMLHLTYKHMVAGIPSPEGRIDA